VIYGRNEGRAPKDKSDDKLKPVKPIPTATLAPTPTLTQDPDPTVTPTPTSLPTPTVVPNITPTITVTPKPQEPPPFVCGGSRNSVCITPIITIPPELEDPNNDCIDPRSPREKIIEWANRHVQRMRNYFNIVFGNPQQPPPPPTPCVLR
jgi:hypothetical protein